MNCSRTLHDSSSDNWPYLVIWVVKIYQTSTKMYLLKKEKVSSKKICKKGSKK